LFPNYTGNEAQIRFKLLDTPRKNGILIKKGRSETIKTIGYLFKFELTAPVELQNTGYFSGFGRFNALGCGYADVV